MRYKCLCGENFWSARPLIKHIKATGHERKITKCLWDALIKRQIKVVLAEGG